MSTSTRDRLERPAIVWILVDIARCVYDIVVAEAGAGHVVRALVSLLVHYALVAIVCAAPRNGSDGVPPRGWGAPARRGRPNGRHAATARHRGGSRGTCSPRAAAPEAQGCLPSRRAGS